MNLPLNNLDNFAETDIPSFSNTASYVVMPLSTSTACYGSSTSGSVPYSAPFGTFGLPTTSWGLVATHEHRGILGTNMFHSADAQMKGLEANVHTGAPPPWLEGGEHDPKNVSLNSYALQSSRKGKSRKLNPKRVGSAWAEGRRAEMKMEKQGELVPETSDSSWLPNFLSVWQSGTRKESRKEFEKNHKLHDKNNHELSPEIKPYISKRMARSMIPLWCSCKAIWRLHYVVVS